MQVDSSGGTSIVQVPGDEEDAGKRWPLSQSIAETEEAHASPHSSVTRMPFRFRQSHDLGV
jgi:hypothetical protein